MIDIVRLLPRKRVRPRHSRMIIDNNKMLYCSWLDSRHIDGRGREIFIECDNWERQNIECVEK